MTSANTSVRVSEKQPADRIGEMLTVRDSGIQYVLKGSGPVVLALHGTLAGCDQSLLFYEHVTRSGYSLLAPSRPGFLGTNISLGSTLAAQADTMIALLDHLQIEKVLICGFSCGGALAVTMAANHPDRVKAMILEAPVTKSYTPTCTTGLHGKLLLSETGARLMTFLIATIPEYGIRRLLERESTYDNDTIRLEARKIFDDPVRRSFALSVLNQCIPPSLRLAGHLNDCAQVADFPSDQLEKVSCPTVILHGTCDREVDFSHGLNASQRIPSAKLIPIPSACHLLCLSEHWNKIQSIREAFLQAVCSNSPDPFAGLSLS